MLSTLFEFGKQTSLQSAENYWKTHIQSWYDSSNPSLSSEYNQENKLADLRWWTHCQTSKTPERARDALERMLLVDSISHEKKLPLLSAMDSLVQPLNGIELFKLPAMPDAGDFCATNPSIVVNPTGDGYTVCVRHVNYHCTEQNEYKCNNPKEKTVHTKNTLYRLSLDLELLDQQWLVDRCTFFRWPSPVMDLEDVRLINGCHVEPHILASCTSREILSTTMPQIVLTRINLATNEQEGGLRLLAHLPPLQSTCQKNWLLWMESETKQLKAIFGFGPSMIIYDVDISTGKCTIWKEFPTGLAFQYARGGTAPLPFGRGYICVIHYAYDQPNLRRHYFHRFVVLDETYKPVRVSETFVIFSGEKGIEFVISSSWHPTRGLILGVGKNDVEAYLALVPMETMIKLKYYII